MNGFETRALFSGTVSFRDASKAQQFLDEMGTLVRLSVEVFHDWAESGALKASLGRYDALLPEFLTNVGDGAAEQGVSRARELRRDAEQALECGETHRQELAQALQGLLGETAVLMQLTEAEASKGFLRNIDTTLEGTREATGGHNSEGVSAQHAEHVRDTYLPVVTRQLRNRIKVAPEERRAPLQELLAALEDAGKALQVGDAASGAELSKLLRALRSQVEVRIGSSAQFNHDVLYHQALQDLQRSVEAGDSRGIVAASKALIKEGKGEQDTKKVITAAKEAVSDPAKKDAALKEISEAKGKRNMYGALPGAIQSLAAILNSREGQAAKPTTEVSGPSAAFGTAQETPAPQTEDPADVDASKPSFSVIADLKK